MAVDAPVSLIEVRNELGLSGICSLLTDIGDATVNQCSGNDDLSPPISLIAWDGYNHAAPPGIPSGFSGNPGNDGSPSEDPQQDSWVYMSWGEIVCAGTYEITAASGSGATSASIATISTEALATAVSFPETSRYYKIRAVAGFGSPSPTYGSATSELHLKTTPSHPKSPAADDSDGGSGGGGSGNITIGVSWNNGTSPGIRVSKVEWRWKQIFTDGGGSYTNYLGPTAVSATSFTQNVGSGHSIGDKFGFEFRYVDGGGGGGSPVAATSSLYWFF